MQRARRPICGFSQRVMLATAFTVTLLSAPSARAASDDCCEIGSSVLHPEAITGNWEMLRPDGSIIGLSISLGASVPDQDEAPANIAWRIDSNYIVTYVRDGSGVGERSWLMNMPVTIAWDRNHLQMRAVSGDGTASKVDLMFDSALSQWRGTFTNADHTGAVLLTRPGPPDSTAPIGTWRGGSNLSEYCVHIAMGADAHLVVWKDNAYGSAMNNGQQPMRWIGWFGDRYEDGAPQQTGEHWRFSIGTSWSGYDLDGTLSADGQTFSGGMRHYGNGVTARGNPALLFSLFRVAGISC